MALVTGGTRGIGRAVVEELAALGAAVHTCSWNAAEHGERLKEWEARGFRLTCSVCDVSVQDQRDCLLREVADHFCGKLDILVNNVGTNIRKPTTEYSVEEYSFLMATNLESAYNLCQIAHPLLKKSGSGSIVFISSDCGVILRNCKVARILPRIVDSAKNGRSAILRARCWEYALLVLEYWADAP